jgi:hypothetical protein
MAKTPSKTGEAPGTSPPNSDSRGTRPRIDPIILIVIAAIAILAVVLFITMSSSTSQPVHAISVETCGEQTLAYANKLLASQGTVATLVSVDEKNGMYQVNVSHQGGYIPLYVTRDCTLLFSQEGWEIGAPLSGSTASACGNRTVTFVNDYLVGEGGTNATLANVKEQHGMFQVNVSYQGEEFPLYATQDCTLVFNIFGDVLDMTVPPPTFPPTPTPTPTPEPVKTDRPSVDLYVMSFCPYGTQAEAAMKPVVDLLGKKADIHLRYITTVTGNNVTSVQSLHGAVEVEEDLRQICIQKDSPANIWSYLTRFNAECYPLSRDAAGMLNCSRNITGSLGIDQSKITVCATGTGGIDLLKTDEGSATENDAMASPTLLINGVEYSGSRTPEAYKLAICGSFTTPPAECSTVISSEQAAAAGSC